MFKLLYQHLSNEDLMLKVQERDDHIAFELIYDRLYKKLYNFIYYIVKNEQRAVELTHDSFFSFYDKRDSFKTGNKVSTWLWTIARNKCFDSLKKKSEVNLGEDESIEEMAFQEDKKLSKLIKEARRDAVKQALEALKDSQREALLMWMDDFTIKDISLVNSKSEQATKNLINRAKKKVKEELEEQLEQI